MQRERLRLAFVVLIGPAFIFVWFQLFPFGSSTVSDDGAYAITASELGDGGNGSVRTPLQDTELAIAAFPYPHPTFAAEGTFLAPRHIVWSAALGFAESLLGTWALRALPALGLALSVFGTYRIARSFARTSASILAAGLVASSPLLYHGLQLWAHAGVSAAITLAVLGTVQALKRGPSVASVALALGGCTIAAMLRGDGLIFALSLTVALGVITVARGRRRGRPDPGLIAISAAMCLVSTAGHRVGVLIAAELTGSRRDLVSPAIDGGLTPGDRLSALAATLFAVPSSEPAAFACLVVAAVSTALAVHAFRNGAGARVAFALLTLASLALLLRLATGPWEPARGLIGAWPIVIFLGLRRLRERNEAEHLLLVMLGVAIVGVAMTQYEGGGGYSWGGRFLAPGVPALAVLIAPPVDQLRKRLRAQGVALTPRLALFVVCMVVPMLHFDASARIHVTDHQHWLDLVDETAVVVTTYEHLPRSDWANYLERQWQRVPSGDDGMARLVAALQSAGVSKFFVYGVAPEHAQWLLRDPFPRTFVDDWGVFFVPIEVRLMPTAPHVVAQVVLPGPDPDGDGRQERIDGPGGAPSSESVSAVP